MNDVRTLKIRPEGWAIFRGWVQSLAEAEAWGEDVPSTQDVDAVVAWLDERHEIEYPLTTEQARILIESCVKGGINKVRRTR